MFLTELKRLETMIAEVVWPTYRADESSSHITNTFSPQDDYTYHLTYDEKKKSFVAQTGDLFPKFRVFPVYLEISIWCNKVGPNQMESVSAVINAFWPTAGKKGNDFNTHVRKEENIVPDVKFLEDMEMKDVEQIALVLLKHSRDMIRTLHERNYPPAPSKEVDHAEASS